MTSIDRTDVANYRRLATQAVDLVVAQYGREPGSDEATVQACAKEPDLFDFVELAITQDPEVLRASWDPAFIARFEAMPPATAAAFIETFVSDSRLQPGAAAFWRGGFSAIYERANGAPPEALMPAGSAPMANSMTPIIVATVVVVLLVATGGLASLLIAL